MLRRDMLIRTLAGASGLPLAAWSQAPPAKARIGFLSGGSAGASSQRNMLDPLRQTLRELGWVEGQNLGIDYRWGEGDPNRLPAMLAELLAFKLDLLVTAGPRPALLAKAATTTLPVVAVAVDDPVQMGLAATMSRPGGNVTGVSSFGIEMLAKRLQLLKDLAPAQRRFAVLMNPATASRSGIEKFLPGYEQALGVTIQAVEARGPDDFEAAFATLARERIGGLVVLADATFFVHRARLGELCTRARLPSVWGGRDYLEGGGLASYQSDFPSIFRSAAAQVDKILRGAKPADMPFEQATKLDFVVNLKAARAMGIQVPRALLAGANEVLE